jgi:hypothetical protein
MFAAAFHEACPGRAFLSHPQAFSPEPLSAQAQNMENTNADRLPHWCGAQVSEYQLQLRNRDEADAVAGIAAGNLSQIVSTREAPKSASSVAPPAEGGGVRSKTLSPQHMATPESNRSALGGGMGFDDRCAAPYSLNPKP